MLSLPFILALVGAAVGLLVGILIFGEVSDAIQCPASGGGGGGGGGSETITFTESYDNLGTLGSIANAVYYEFESPSNFVSTTGILNQAVIQNGTSSLDSNGEIYLGFGQNVNDIWTFFHRGATGMDEVSINLWINGDVDGSPAYPILSNRNSFEDGFNLLTQGTTTYLYVYEALTNRLSASAPTIPPDDSQWHMLTITYDKSITAGNANAVIYLDGVAVGGGNTDSNFDGTGSPSPSLPLTIGSDADHDIGGGVTENTFDVDDVAVWNGYLLTPTDVTNLYNAGAGSAAGSISSTELVGYWSFDDPTANTFEYEVGGVLFDTLGETSDGTYSQNPGWWIGQLVATTGEQITAVTINDMDNQVNVGNLTSEIWTGATTDIDSATLVATSNNKFNNILFDPGLDFTWVFNPPVTVNDPNTFIALHASSNWDSSNQFLTSSTDIGSGVFWVHDEPTNSGFSTPPGFADMLMKVETVGNGTGGGESETGSEQCQQAKDTAWQVIGIMPIALFFGLFALFSSVTKPQ